MIAEPLALLACLAMTGPACAPPAPPPCHGDREQPRDPAACHAALSCAAHRRVRNIP